MKKILLMFICLIMPLTLTCACSNQQAVQDNTSIQKMSYQRSHQLDKAVKKYGHSRHYVKYDGKSSIRLANGRLYPDAFKLDKFYLHGKRIDIGWDPYNRHSYTYRVLALYNCNLSNKQHDTLLFCFHKGKPIVLIDRGQESNHVDLVQSNDKGLNSDFVGIMNGFNK